MVKYLQIKFDYNYYNFQHDITFLKLRFHEDLFIGFLLSKIVCIHLLLLKINILMMYIKKIDLKDCSILFNLISETKHVLYSSIYHDEFCYKLRRNLTNWYVERLLNHIK